MSPGEHQPHCHLPGAKPPPHPSPTWIHFPIHRSQRDPSLGGMNRDETVLGISPRRQLETPSSSSRAAAPPCPLEERWGLCWLPPAGTARGSACCVRAPARGCIHQPINLQAGLLPNFRTFLGGRVKMQLLRQMRRRAARRD